MAALENTSRNVTFKVVTGTSELGKAIYTNRTIHHINPEATPADLQPVMSALAALQRYTLGSTVVTDTSDLTSGTGE